VPVRTLLICAVLALAAGLGVSGPLAAGPDPTPSWSQSDLDAFMARVLETRDDNWKKVQQYILDERETIQVKGPAAVPIYGSRREFTWYIRDGYFVRSPLSVDGVRIAESERRSYEEKYLARVKARDRREQERAGRRAEETGKADTIETQAGTPAQVSAGSAPGEPGVESLIAQTEQPRFIDSAYFLEFKFEQGRYALVGPDTFDGREVLKIEYYPARLFSDDEKEDQPREENLETTIERLMNKVSMVTLWVEPESHQIVRYTFDNLHLDFLPGAWLVRVDDVRATMSMMQPFPDVWLPRGVEMHFSAMLALGAFTLDYRLEYDNYRRAETGGRIIGVTIGRGRGGGGGAGGAGSQP